MKKKVLYGVAMALVATASMGTLQSCKDDLDDLKIQVDYNQDVLKGLIDALRGDLQACQADCAAKIADLQRQITDNDGDIDALRTAIQELEGEIANRVTIEDLQNKLNQLDADLKKYTDDAVDGLKAELTQDINAIKGDITVLRTDLNDLKADYAAKVQEYDQRLAKHDEELTNLRNDVTNLGGQIEELQDELASQVIRIDQDLQLKQAQIDAINTELEGLKTTVASHTELISELTRELQELSEKYDALEEEFNQRIGGLEEFISEVYDTLGGAIGSLASQISDLQDQIDALNDKFDELTERMNDLITGIILQGTDNPIFGNFSMPIGVKSNMLFNWYGENLGQEFMFPSPYAENAYNAESPLLTKADLDFLLNNMALKQVQIPAGYLAEEFDLGKLYMTINPVGHNFNNTALSLETSAGKKLPFGITAVPSNDELTFGYTTKSVENGFYEANVTLPATDENINAAKIKIDEGLETAVKDILNDRSKRTALNLLKAVYDQMNSMLPAYALRYDWTSGENNYSVLSGYDLAVATAQPLSYRFLEGKGTDKRIRTFGHINNFMAELKDRVENKFDLSKYAQDITVQGKSVKFVAVNGHSNLEFSDADNQVVVTVYGLSVGGQVLAPFTASSDVDGIVDALNEALCNAVLGTFNNPGDDVRAEVKVKVDRVLLQINQEVNDVIASIQGSIDNAVEDVYGKAEPYFSRVNRLIDIYNRVANKVNDFLAAPNEYLQVAMFYKASGKVGILSSVKEDPTVFANGGGQAFNLFLTSYTAETVAPAFKKYVAVVNVYDANGKSVRDAEWKSLAEINSYSSGLNRVLDGSTHKIAVPATSMKAGYTYEFVYQGVDYSGVTSTRKFYIKVK